MNGRRRKNNWVKWVVVGVVIAVLLVFAWPSILQTIQGTAPASTQTGNLGTAATAGNTATGQTQGSYTAVTRGNLQVTAYGSGSLKPQETYSVFNDSEGKIDEIAVQAGDSVKAGDVLVRLSSSEIETNIATYEKDLFAAQVALGDVRDTGSDYYVYSPSAGTLKTLMCEVDDDVASVMKQYGYLAIVSRDDKMRVEFEPLPGYDFAIGDKVSVWIDNVAVVGTVDQTVGIGGNIAVTLIDEEYETGTEVLITTPQGEKVGTGVLEINMPIPITAIGGTVEKVYYEEGDSIGSGYKLFYTTGRLPSSDLQSALLTYQEARTALDNEKDKQNNLIVRAPIDGVVTSVDVSQGARLDESTSLVTLQSATRFSVVAAVDELDIVNVAVGQSVQVEIDAFPGQTFDGTVERISGVGVVSGGVATYEVTVNLPENVKLMDGMTASIEIVVADKQNVLLVPVEAISTSNGQKYVTLQSGTTTSVTTGLSDDTNVEILTGVSEGDMVRINRATSSTSSNQQFGGNMMIAAPGGMAVTQGAGGVNVRRGG